MGEKELSKNDLRDEIFRLQDELTLERNRTKSWKRSAMEWEHLHEECDAELRGCKVALSQGGELKWQ